MFGIEGISANLIYDVAIKSYSIFNQKKLLEKIIKKSAKKSGIPKSVYLTFSQFKDYLFYNIHRTISIN